MLTKRGGLIMSDNYEKAVNAVDLSKERIEEMRFLLYRNFLATNPGAGGDTAFIVASSQLGIYLELKEKEDYGGFLEDCKKALVGRTIKHIMKYMESCNYEITDVTHRGGKNFNIVSSGIQLYVDIHVLDDLLKNGCSERKSDSFMLAPGNF